MTVTPRRKAEWAREIVSYRYSYRIHKIRELEKLIDEGLATGESIINISRVLIGEYCFPQERDILYEIKRMYNARKLNIVSHHYKNAPLNECIWLSLDQEENKKKQRGRW